MSYADTIHDTLGSVPSQYWLYATAAVVVLAIAAWRYRSDRRWFGRDDAKTWRVVRHTAIPLLGRVARRLDPQVDTNVYVWTEVTPAEHVATLDVSLGALLDDLDGAGYEPQPLASLATNWAGQTERASWARYYGDPLFPGAPDWLRKRQVHVRVFPSPSGRYLVVTAHDEYNPWAHPIKHYRGETFDPETGRRHAALDLGIDLEPLPDASHDRA